MMDHLPLSRLVSTQPRPLIPLHLSFRSYFYSGKAQSSTYRINLKRRIPVLLANFANVFRWLKRTSLSLHQMAGRLKLSTSMMKTKEKTTCLRRPDFSSTMPSKSNPITVVAGNVPAKNNHVRLSSAYSAVRIHKVDSTAFLTKAAFSRHLMVLNVVTIVFYHLSQTTTFRNPYSPLTLL
jgi:hypothetical protein